MSSSLQGRRAIVTGAGRNVGEAIAWRFAGEGAKVAVADINLEAASKVADAINDAHPDSAVAVACDVSSGTDVQRMVEDSWAALGSIDTLVNCVAITDRPATVLDLPDDLWQRVIDITLTAAFLTTKYTAQRMVAESSGGVIVHIGSTSGQFARKNALAYPTAKAGLYGLVKSLALQLGEHGIRVNTVSPNKVGSPVGTDVEPENRPRKNLIGRGCRPEDIANAVAFMVSDQAGFITGTDLLVDGGALIASGD